MPNSNGKKETLDQHPLSNGNEDEQRIKSALDEYNEAKEQRRIANEKVKEKRATLLDMQKHEGTVPLVYQVNIKQLEVLCNNRVPISGYKDLFSQVLILRRNDNGNQTKAVEDKDKYTPSQISVRIRKQGMKAIEEYCVIEKITSRELYIKSMKILEVKSKQSVNMRDLNREIEIAEKLKKLRELRKDDTK
jgi:hypothetical protein